MRKVVLILLFLFTLGNIGMSQVEWKVFSGFDLTPIVANSFTGSGSGFDSNNNYYEMRENTKRTLENQGSAGFSLNIPLKRLVFEFNLYMGRYRLIEDVRQEFYHYQGSQEQIFETWDRTNYSRNIYPGGKFFLGYSVTQKFVVKLFFGNFGKGLYMNGLAADIKFGKHWNVGVSGYKPVAIGVETGWKLEKNYGIGFQLGYSFSQKEKSKKSNSSPTVL